MSICFNRIENHPGQFNVDENLIWLKIYVIEIKLIENYESAQVLKIFTKMAIGQPSNGERKPKSTVT
jgi:hypothetical protein